MKFKKDQLVIGNALADKKYTMTRKGCLMRVTDVVYGGTDRFTGEYVHGATGALAPGLDFILDIDAFDLYSISQYINKFK